MINNSCAVEIAADCSVEVLKLTDTAASKAFKSGLGN